MIVSRRFGFRLGRGTDLPSYSRSTAGTLSPGRSTNTSSSARPNAFTTPSGLAHSQMELVESVDQIEHRIYREALLVHNRLNGASSFRASRMPANSGLGSSGTFTVALLNALHAYKHEFVAIRQLAEACHVEIDIPKEPIGKQDQYIAACGESPRLPSRRTGRCTRSGCPCAAR